MPTLGTTYYLTGGTTGPSGLCAHSPERLNNARKDIADILHAYGVSSESRVLVAFPFDPWAIGGLFRDATIIIGAEVLPMGLMAADTSAIQPIKSFKPDVVCASHRLFNRLTERITCLDHTHQLFHAGEPLLNIGQSPAGNGHPLQITNIFGCAEYDTIAVGTGAGPLRLNPRLESRIEPMVGTGQSSDAIGCGYKEHNLTGELFVRWRSSNKHSPWFQTGDIVKEVAAEGYDGGLWEEQRCFELVGRSDEFLDFIDGTTVSRRSIQTALGLCNTRDTLQAQVFNEVDGQHVILTIHTDTPERYAQINMRERLLARIPELADVVRCGLARITVRPAPRGGVYETPRGKQPFIVREQE